MWSLDNRTPLGAERSWVRDVKGTHHWIVAVQAVYDVSADGRCRLAPEQSAPPLEPKYRGDDGASSLVRDGELSWRKPAVDVVVEGSAFAPDGKPRPSVPVALKCGPIDKTVLVRGDSVYVDGVAGLTTTSPQPFAEMPLTYERAFGGLDDSAGDAADHRLCMENPVGVGFSRHARGRVKKPAPNVVHAKEPLRDAVVGLGAIASHWHPRAPLAGTYDAKWVETRKPLLPTDFDPRFSLCAPADQRLPVGSLGPGGRVDVVHMSPAGVFSASLPRVELQFTTFFGPRRERHVGTMSTVFIEPGASRLTLVWQTHLEVPRSKIDRLDETRIEGVVE